MIRSNIARILTEANLGLILNDLFPHNDFLHDKAVPYAINKRLRPDYRSDEMKIILEYDGDSYYCESRVTAHKVNLYKNSLSVFLNLCKLIILLSETL